MSYKDLLEQAMGFSPQVTEYFDPIIAISMGGVSADVYSAYPARQLELPGTQAHYQSILNSPIDFSALDRPANPLSIRLNATAIDVSHAGPAENSDHVNVSYYKDGKISCIKVKTVVVSIGGWVARNIVSDMPSPIEEAYRYFHHAPILVVNVAFTQLAFSGPNRYIFGPLVRGIWKFLLDPQAHDHR